MATESWERRLPPEQEHQEREQYAQQNGRGQRKVERHWPASDREVTRQPKQRESGHHHDAQDHQYDPADDQELSHGVLRLPSTVNCKIDGERSTVNAQ